jgi:hypothetical protein
MSSLMNAARRGEHGMAVVAVVVLIALLFLSGTAMALLVSSNLHTLDVVVHQDRVHYAAESAVARGVVAAASEPLSCSPADSINNQPFTTLCETPIDGLDARSLKEWSVPGGRLTIGCHSYPIKVLGQWKAAWTVVGWRTPDRLAAVAVWIDNRQQCDIQPSSSSVSPAYVSGTADKSMLHIAVSGGSVELGGFVVRAANKGDDTIVTVVGQAGFEVDEADAAVPAGDLKLWNTVLP